jgi:hypothetical protein
MAATRAAIDADEDRDYDDDEEPDDDDEPDYEPAAGAPWGWIIGVAVLVCGFGSIIFVRRWLPVVADDFRARTPGLRSVAPYAADGPIYAPRPAYDENVGWYI